MFNGLEILGAKPTSEYIQCGIETFELHDAMTEQRRKALRLHWWWHILVFAVYRPYDPARQRYSLRYLFSPVRSRMRRTSRLMRSDSRRLATESISKCVGNT